MEYTDACTGRSANRTNRTKTPSSECVRGSPSRNRQPMGREAREVWEAQQRRKRRCRHLEGGRRRISRDRDLPPDAPPHDTAIAPARRRHASLSGTASIEGMRSVWPIYRTTRSDRPCQRYRLRRPGHSCPLPIDAIGGAGGSYVLPV